MKQARPQLVACVLYACPCHCTCHIRMPFIFRGASKKPKFAPAGPKGTTSLRSSRGRRTASNITGADIQNYPRAHMCMAKGCQGQHTQPPSASSVLTCTITHHPLSPSPSSPTSPNHQHTRSYTHFSTLTGIAPPTVF